MELSEGTATVVCMKTFCILGSQEELAPSVIHLVIHLFPH